ncbi:MAG: hypothetical protein Q7T18_02985, partial [Sedimentisphaerales bacterium]|nr:hypothetical protein [Sedimentisphaerales bacterium]
MFCVAALQTSQNTKMPNKQVTIEAIRAFFDKTAAFSIIIPENNPTFEFGRRVHCQLRPKTSDKPTYFVQYP